MKTIKNTIVILVIISILSLNICVSGITMAEIAEDVAELTKAGLYFMDRQLEPPSMELPPVAATEATTQSSTQNATQIPSQIVTEIPTQGTTPAEPGAIIWGDGAEDLSFPLEYGEKGVVAAYNSVVRAMDEVKNPQDVLALYVFDASREEKATNEEIYTQVLKPLGIEDKSFLKTGYTFLTKEQILAMECPENMAICLCMKYKYIRLTSEYLENSNQESFYVEAYLTAPEGVWSEAEALYSDSYNDRCDYVCSERRKIIRECLDYLGLEEFLLSEDLSAELPEMGGFVGAYTCYFWGELDKETVVKLVDAWEKGMFCLADVVETDGLWRGEDY